MPRVKLNDDLIMSTEPKATLYVLSDINTPGLQCFINPKGKKTFKFRVVGVQKEIGRFPFTKYAEAKKIAHIWYGDLLKEGALKKEEEIEAKDTLLDDLIKEYLDYKQVGTDALAPWTFYQYSFVWRKYISPAIGQKFLSELTDVDINKFFSSLKKISSRIKGCRSILKPAFSYADSMGYNVSHLHAEKWIRVRGGKKDRYFTTGELNRLQEILTDSYGRKRISDVRYKHLIILQLLIYTGCRSGELLKLRWEDVFLEEGYIQLWKTKTKKGRIIPIISIIYDLLKKIPRILDEPYVFFSVKKKTRHLSYPPLETFWLSLMKEGNFNDRDIEPLTIHSLRHTYITVANRAGISPWTLATLVGHSVGNSITGLYIHHNLQELKKAQEQITLTLNMGNY